MAASEYRLAEPLAALSVATDLARGQPPEQALYACIIATKLTDYMGLGLADRASTYFATLLRFAGCTATSHEYAQFLGGNDIAVRFGGDAIDPANANQLASLLISLGKGAMGPANAMQIIAEGTRADCEVGARMASRVGLEKSVADSLLHIFERWDGHGLPNGIGGEDIPRAARMGHVASAFVMFSQATGPSEALGTLGKWSGSILDPTITSFFIAHSDEMRACLEVPDVWQAALAAEPAPWRTFEEGELDDICRVFGDFVDLKTPFLLGHSAQVARLAEGAARALNLSDEDCITLRRAGWLHDLGRAGVSSGIWEKPAPLSTLEAEQAHLHPYHSERILERSTLFRPLARIVGQHHERIDGSGYFRGLASSSLDRHSRVLAAADACAELLEDRPGRKALSPDEAATELSKQALDPDAVRAVLEVAGAKRPGSPPQRPAGLTSREVEVLRLLARGETLNQIADQLVISPSTAHTHAAHVYEKAAISTRAGAALFAMEHGLLS
jgi:HD-GYP domain-containing protein (c-di-GMP phosphodiesterase class II)